jgi:hypothetical protein
MTVTPSSGGAQCPRCSFPLTADWIKGSGIINCPNCSRAFEATTFNPPQRQQVAAAAEMATVGPEGANACANHALNAATASCQRCGLFICALCDMNVGSGSYCPSCFDRVRTEGTLQPAARRYRDYATMSRTFALAGLFLTFFLLSIPVGAAAMYYGFKARKQRREEKRSSGGVVFFILFGLVDVLIGLGYIGFILYGIASTK